LISDERFATAPVRFENRKGCIAELRATFAAEDLAHWEKSFAGLEGVWDVMRTARETHDDAQVIAIGR
jgi:crotonobetainyl-CoA:carnitine CoA-transferase CaiB-like acyl-CoA transferase